MRKKAPDGAKIIDDMYSPERARQIFEEASKDIYGKMIGNINSKLINELEPYLIEKYTKSDDRSMLEDGSLIKIEEVSDNGK